MKKIILVLCILALTTTAHAACNGGTERNGFCISNIELNWWSAEAWCQSNGRALATMYEVCPEWDGNIGNAKCSVLGGNGFGWTATASANYTAFGVYFGNGNVGTSGGRNLENYAICK